MVRSSLRRPLTVTIHQCRACGYASIYRQKAVRHAEGGRCTSSAAGVPSGVETLERVIPADADAGDVVSSRKIACGSDEERVVWEETVRDYLRVGTAKMTADRACFELFREFRARAGNVRVRGSSVLEFRGDGNETSVPLAKYCVWAAHDIARRVALVDADGEAAQRLKDLFAAPLSLDDFDSETSWASVLRDKFHKRPLELDDETRDSLADLYQDMEAALLQSRS